MIKVKYPNNKKYFLLGGKVTATIIVQETVKEAIEKELKGFSLTHINDYKGK